MFDRPAFLGKVRLGCGAYQPVGPFWGEYSRIEPDGKVAETVRVGPFQNPIEAVQKTVTEAANHGVTQQNGVIVVKDSAGVQIGGIA